MTEADQLLARAAALRDEAKELEARAMWLMHAAARPTPSTKEDPHE